MGTHMCISHVGLLVIGPFHDDGHGHGGMYVCMWRPRVQQQTRLGFEHSLIRLGFQSSIVIVFSRKQRSIIIIIIIATIIIIITIRA